MDHDIHALGFMVVLHVGLLNVDIHRQVDTPESNLFW